MGVDISRWSHLTDFVGHSIGAFFSTVMFNLLRYADKRIVIIMKMYIERNNLQLE